VGAASTYWLAAAMSVSATVAALVLSRAWDGNQVVRDQT
jgi:hypothetical protein